MNDRNGRLNQTGIGTLFWTFLKIGSTAFGGFMALISVVQSYVVERRQLLSQDEMLDGISLATVLPGPVAMNVVAYVGYKIRGAKGALVCTVAVTMPTFIFILILSYSYFTWGEIPSVNRFFQGFIPAVAAIIVVTAWNMGRKNIKGLSGFAIAVFSFVALTAIGGFFITLAVIAISGTAGYWLYKEPSRRSQEIEKSVSHKEPNKKSGGGSKLYGVNTVPVLAVAAPFFSTDVTMAFRMLYTSAGMSLFLFGGGFVFIPLIQEIVVDGYGWVTHKEFIDGIALGQVTPGPILISAAFIGYKMAGLFGAIAATIGIFTPPAVLMVFSARYLERVKHSTLLKASMQGIRSGVIGMIFAAALVVAATAQMNWISILIFLMSMVALLKYRFEVAVIIPVSGAVGLIMY